MVLASYDQGRWPCGAAQGSLQSLPEEGGEEVRSNGVEEEVRRRVEEVNEGEDIGGVFWGR